MTVFFSQLINGLSLGSIYALIALGYSMVYGIILLLNFAHGDVIMVGAYMSWFVMNQLGLGPVTAVCATIITCTLLGVVIEKIAYTPLRNAPRISLLITAIGVSFFLEYTAELLMGSGAKVIPSYFEARTFYFGKVPVGLTSVTPAQRSHLPFRMDPCIEKNILQDAVSQAGNPLFRGKERFGGKIRLGSGHQTVEISGIKPVVERGRLRQSTKVVGIVQFIPESIDPAIHGHREDQETVIIECYQQLVFGRNVRTGRTVTHVHPVRKRNMHLILQQQVGKCTVS